MEAFDYVRPSTIAEAVIAVSQPGAVYMAGGTSLLDLMKIDILRPARIVDITRIQELADIDWRPDGTVRIGALMRNAALANDQTFAQSYPAVAEALLSGASPQIRNAATVAGNLLQHARCPYFQEATSACNRRVPGNGCDALGGDTRLGAVLGWSEHCIATHPSDFCVPLIALDAVVEIAGPTGRREVSLEEIYRLPADAPPDKAIALQHGELVTAIRLPPSARMFLRHSRYLKLRERTSFAFALVSGAAMLRLQNGVVAEARIALGGVAAKPWRVRSAEAVLVGAKPNFPAFCRAADLLLAGASASGNNAFKIELARRLAMRVLALATDGTPEMPLALPASVFSSRVPAMTMAQDQE